MPEPTVADLVVSKTKTIEEAVQRLAVITEIMKKLNELVQLELGTYDKPSDSPAQAGE